MNRYGIGLRPPHYTEVLTKPIPIDWLEIHSENFFHEGGFLLDKIRAVRDHYPLSLHGVSLSLGSPESPNKDHLKRLKQLITQLDPFLISEHLSWSRVAGHYLPDLLPLPYTHESLQVFVDNVNYCQEYLGRTLLIENPSSYFEYHATEMSEVHFLVSLCQKTGAKILLDVNNVYVSCCNHQWDPLAYLEAIPADLIGEIHLAGHSTRMLDNQTLLRIDTHDHPVCEEVWALYQVALKRVKAVPILIEWDAHIPPLETLLEEANRARTLAESLTNE